MKLRINYDLVDKVSEAKQGYSLKRCVKRVFAFSFCYNEFSGRVCCKQNKSCCNRNDC